MPTPIARTPDGKWTLYRVTDGQRFERWPVDARAMLATGEYTADPPDGDDSQTATVAPGSEAAPDAPALPASLPAEHSPGVPLVAVTEGTPAAPIATAPAPRSRGKRK